MLESFTSSTIRNLKPGHFPRLENVKHDMDLDTSVLVDSGVVFEGNNLKEKETGLVEPDDVCVDISVAGNGQFYCVKVMTFFILGKIKKIVEKLRVVDTL